MGTIIASGLYRVKQQPPKHEVRNSEITYGVLRGVYSDTTQLYVELSTREQLSPISSERRDPVDSVCRSWRHIWRVLTSLPGDGILEWRVWRKVNRIMKKTCLFIWHFIDQSLQQPCKKAAALENISQEMNVACWYISISHITMRSTGNKNTTDLLRVDSCSTGSVALPIVRDSWVASVRVFIATQLNSTSSWVASL